MSHIEHTPNPLGFGPAVEDIATYKELMSHLDEKGDRELSFRPRVNAEHASERIDDRRLGSFSGHDDTDSKLGYDSRLRIGQQRYIAGMLGFVVGKTEINVGSGTIGVGISTPDLADLPALPVRQADGTYKLADGTALNTIQRDMLYSAHLLAHEDAVANAPNGMQRIFRWVVERADNGRIVVPASTRDSRATVSLARQAGRVLGYKMGAASRGADGHFYVPVTGINEHLDDVYSPYRHDVSRKKK